MNKEGGSVKPSQQLLHTTRGGTRQTTTARMTLTDNAVGGSDSETAAANTAIRCEEL